MYTTLLAEPSLLQGIDSSGRGDLLFPCSHSPLSVAVYLRESAHVETIARVGGDVWM